MFPVSYDEFSPRYSYYPSGATATVMGAPGYPNIRGTVDFVQMPNGVAVQTVINGLPPTPTNFFAFHLHEGVCGNPGMDPSNYFPESGGHYNPENQPHPRHAGDFPPLLRTDDGSAHLAFITDRFNIQQIIGRSVIIHLNPDDFKTQPSGGSGPKIACGLIIPGVPSR